MTICALSREKDYKSSYTCKIELTISEVAIIDAAFNSISEKSYDENVFAAEMRKLKSLLEDGSL